MGRKATSSLTLHDWRMWLTQKGQTVPVASTIPEDQGQGCKLRGQGETPSSNPKADRKGPPNLCGLSLPPPSTPPTPVQSARPSSPGETKFPQSPAWSSTRRQTQGTHGRWKTLSRSQRTQTEQQGMGAASFRKAANKRSREGGNQSESFMDDDRVSPSSRKQRQEVAGP